VGVDRARDHAIASLERRRKFAQDSVAYVAVNGLLWLIWLITDRKAGGSIPWPAWVSLVWGFVLALDGWRAYGRWPASLNTPITETDIERELERGQHR
jgi:2TM domain